MKHSKFGRIQVAALAFAGIGSIAMAGYVSTPPTADGTISAAEYGETAALASQNTQTGFGDNSNELDCLHVANDATYLYVGITGNLAAGNRVYLYFDTDNALTGAVGAANLSDPALTYGEFDDLGTTAGALDLPGTTLLPEYALSYGDGCLGWGRYVALNGTFEGCSSPFSNGFDVVLDNSNTQGVEGGSGAAVSLATTATTGMEFRIPLSELGCGFAAPIKMFAMLTGTGAAPRTISNQFLPGLATPGANLGTNPASLTFNTAAVNYVVRGPAPNFYDSISDTGSFLAAATCGRWTTHSGAINQVPILNTASDSGNSLARTGLAAPAGNRFVIDNTVSTLSEDIGRSFAPITGDGNSLYASFLIKFNTAPSSATGGYFANFFEGTSGTLFKGRFWAQLSGSGAKLGVTGTGSAPVWASTVLTVGQTYLVVVKASMVTGTGPNDTYSIWVDPVSLGGSEPSGAAVYTAGAAGEEFATATGIGRFAFRTSYNATNNAGKMELDEVRVGTTWASVTPAPIADVLDGVTAVADGSGPVSFGSAQQGSGAITKTFTVQNNGTATLNTSGLTVSGAGFSAGADPLAATIAAGSSDTFSVVLSDSTVGPFSGSVSFTSDDIDRTPYDFTISGTITAPPAPEVAVNEPGFGNVPDAGGPVGFGSILNGSGSVTKTFTVSNTGTAALNTSALAVNNTGGSAFSLGADPLDASIPAGGSDTFTVVMADSSNGSFTADVSFTNDDSDENPFNFSISGDVSAAPVPEVAVTETSFGNITDGTSTVDFGTHLQGAATVTLTFTVNNTGSAALTTSNFAVSGTGFTAGSDALAASIPAGSSDTFTVDMATTSLGALSGGVTFDNNDSDENPFNFNLSGTITAPEVAVSETTFGNVTDGSSDVDFGSATVGGAAIVKTFTVTNAGTSTLNLSNLTVGGADFSVGADTLVASLAPAASDTFTVSLATTTSGAKTGTVSFTNDDSDENPFNFAIHGQINGTAPTLATVANDAAGTSFTLTFSKAMTTTGTYLATPGGAPNSVVASGNQVTLGYSSALAGYPTITSLAVTGATATDGGAYSGTFNLVARHTSTANLRASVNGTTGVSDLEGLTTTDADGAWVTTQDIIEEITLDGTRQNASITGSPSVTVRGSAANTWLTAASGDMVEVCGQVTSFRGLLEIINVSGGNPRVRTISTGNALPAPVVVNSTDAADMASFEPLESGLIRINGVHFVSGPGATFPVATGTGTNYTISNQVAGTPALTLRLDSDISHLAGADGFDGKAAPAGNFDVIGQCQQFDSSNPFTTGYQILPLSYTGIITPATAVQDWTVLDTQ